MQDPHIPVLLTSSVIAHDAGVSLRDPVERTRLAMESVRHWLRLAPGAPIVLCDGSGFDFSGSVHSAFPGAKIECLFFENDQRAVIERGRGYGEGEIVRYAIEHSREINAAGAFAKCTSKLWVENYQDCMRYWNGSGVFKGVFDNVFSALAKTKFVYIDTRFYLVTVDFYKRYFLYAHHGINPSTGYGLEDCFHAVFLERKLAGYLLPSPPVVCGVGGGIGKYYKNTAVRRFKERLRYAIVRKLPEFKPWFTGLARK
jgi:hypothetical protein